MMRMQRRTKRGLIHLALTLALTVFIQTWAIAEAGVLTLPESTKVIAARAFYGLTEVTRIVLPDGVMSIGSEAFGGSEGLQAVEAADTLLARYTEDELAGFLTDSPNARFIARADYSLFEWEAQDGAVTITKYLGDAEALAVPARIDGLPVTAIGSSAFSNNDTLKKVTLPEGLLSIGSSAFYYCRNLKEATLPSSLTSIGQNAFYRCGYYGDGITLKLPDHINEVSSSTFDSDAVLECSAGTKTTSALMEAGINFCLDANHDLRYGRGTYNGENALFLTDFKGNKTALTAVQITEGVVGIGSSVFDGCKNLTDIQLPTTLRSIGYRAFKECGVNSEERFYIALPDGLDKIDSDAFYWCDTDDKMVFECAPGTAAASAISAKYSFTVEGAHGFRLRYMDHTEPTETEPYRNVKRLYMTAYLGEDGAIAIPEGVEVINKNAFWGNETVKAITFPESIIAFEENAFNKCLALERVAIPEKITEIPVNAFRECVKLKEVIFHPGVIRIRSSAFYNAGKEVDKKTEGTFYYVLPDNIAGYSYAPFRDCGAVLVTKKDSQTARWLCGVENNEAVSGDEYQFAAPGETDFRYRYIATTANGVTTWQLHLMQYVGNGAAVDIPAGVECIQGTAFTNNTVVTKVTIPEGVTEIRENAFTGCTNLTDMTFPSTLKKLEQNVFVNCGQNATAPFSFRLPDDMESVVMRQGGNCTFKDCNVILVCGRESQTAALLTDKNYIYTTPGETDFRYRYESYTEGTETGRRLWLVGYEGTEASVTIPTGIYGIKRYTQENASGTYPRTWFGNAFYENRAVTSVIIPEGTVVIENSAFMGCANLTDISFPGTMKTLKDHAFESCGSASDARFIYSLPGGITTMTAGTGAGWDSFNNCAAVLVAPKDSSTCELLSEGNYVHYHSVEEAALNAGLNNPHAHDPRSNKDQEYRGSF